MRLPASFLAPPRFVSSHLAALGFAAQCLLALYRCVLRRSSPFVAPPYAWHGVVWLCVAWFGLSGILFWRYGGCFVFLWKAIVVGSGMFEIYDVVWVVCASVARSFL